MRYKAYYNETDIVNWKPGQNIDNYDTEKPLLENDDLHALQADVQHLATQSENRLLFIQKVKIIDTFYEEKFNKKQEEFKQQNTEYIRQALSEAVQQFNASESIGQMKKLIAQSLSQHPLIGTQISEGEIFLKQVDQNTYELSLPTYNIDKITFSL